jgi:osmotically inducible protein OsmC
MPSFTRSAVLDWSGDVVRGAGQVAGTSGAFRAAATFPRLSGEPAGATTPEELLAAAHATCFGIGLRAVLAQRGGSADRLRVTATITAEKGGGRIRIAAAHLDGVVAGLAGVDPAALDEIGRAAEAACTISAVLHPTVPVTVSVRADPVA